MMGPAGYRSPLARVACPLQTDPAAMRAAGEMKEVVDAAEEAFS